MNILIRTDSSEQIGSGHVMRCLTLANELRQKAWCVSFICRTRQYVRLYRANALEEVQRINNFCHIIEFSNVDINQTCNLMLQDSDYKDLEDTVQ